MLSYELAEISYDLVMDHDMEFVEGTYRLTGEKWQVVIVSKCDIDSPAYKWSEWQSGVTGVVIHFPNDHKISGDTVEAFLSSILPVQKWKRVKGPDSMQLR